MRGLKQGAAYAKTLAETVASFTDAWIETIKVKETGTAEHVASFTDAWIETVTENTLLTLPGWSHLLQMRGLKQNQLYTHCRPRQVASFTDAWIETGLYVSVIKRGAGRIFYRCVD